MSPPHAGHSSGNFSPTRAISLAQAIREVSCERGFWFASPQPPVACSSLACPPVVASRCFSTLPFRQSRDGRPQRVVRRKHSVIAMPVPPRLWDEIRKSVQKLKRRELDDAAGPRLRGLSLSAWPDPVGGLVPGHHIADASDAAVGVADHGEPLECKRGPGTVPQEMLERLKVARHVAVY